MLKAYKLAHTYQQTQSHDILAFLSADSACRELKSTVRIENWDEFLQSINTHPCIREVWDKIYRITKLRPTNPFSHYPDYYVTLLPTQWPVKLQLISLPIDIKDHLASTRIDREFHSETVFGEVMITDSTPITAEEFRSVPLQGKAAWLEEDGITQSVQHLMSVTKPGKASPPPV